MQSKIAVLFAVVISSLALHAGEAYDPAKATGSVKGVVLWEGEALPVRNIVVAGDPACQKCRTAPGGVQLVKEEFVMKDGKLANVVVYVSKGHEKYNFEAVTLPPQNLNQKCCQYIPHVMAMKTGQKLEVESADAFAHNIHGTPKENKEFNFGMAGVGISKTTPKFDTPELGAKIQCDVHSWMTAFVCVFDHTLFAVSKEDGSFDIKLPPGKYTLSVWHESTKVSKPAPIEITVEDGKAAEAKFTYTKK